MLSGVTRKMAGQFFAALDADIAGVGAGPAPASPGAGPSALEAADAAAPTPRSFDGRAPGAAEPSVLEGSRGFALGVVAGGVIAVVGVALGARLGRRH